MGADGRGDAAPHWAADVLGERFEQCTLALAPDDEGDVVATLVRRRAQPGDAPDRGIDVLYVHGWSDYFFQTELADFWAARGARFHAIDLRKYGRSLRPGQTPGYVTELADYDEDLDAALTVLGHGPGAAPTRRLVLMGHSTGGLTLSLWLARHAGRAAALVLNSPWLEFQTRALGRRAIEPIVGLRARIDPRAPMIVADPGFYTRSVSAQFDGTWDYDLAWRPERGFGLHPAWLSAILRGQAQVARGLGIEAPILTLLSTRSTLLPRWTPDMMRTDTALDVTGVARRTLDLGLRCTIVRIEGALHDVTLSSPPARAVAYAEMARWVAAYVPSP